MSAADLFRWLPGRGPDTDALARMRRAFRKPPAPMGEAWFMSETRFTFDRFTEIPILDLPLKEFGSFLFELTSGISSFGPSEEWSSWFAYVLPDLILRSHETYAFNALLEATVSAFMNVYWSENAANYPRFEEDVALTLGRCLMKPELWIDPKTPRLEKIRGVRGNSQDVVFWGQTSGDFSAAMFVALRTFPIEALPDFIDSVIAIDDAAWRARLVTWLWGATSLLKSNETSSHVLTKCLPPIDWENAHCIGPRDAKVKSILSKTRCDVTLAHFQKRLEPVLANWTFDEEPVIADVMKSLDATGCLFDVLF